jgi:hypothetical protein
MAAVVPYAGQVAAAAIMHEPGSIAKGRMALPLCA